MIPFLFYTGSYWPCNKLSASLESNNYHKSRRQGDRRRLITRFLNTSSKTLRIFLYRNLQQTILAPLRSCESQLLDAANTIWSCFLFKSIMWNLSTTVLAKIISPNWLIPKQGGRKAKFQKKIIPGYSPYGEIDFETTTFKKKVNIFSNIGELILSSTAWSN